MSTCEVSCKLLRVGQLYQKIVGKSKPLLLIVILAILACSKLIAGSFYTSHDGEGHVIRMEEFDSSIKEGQFPVRIAKRINHGLGYPFFNFNYPAVYYSSEAIHSLGFNFVDTFKILMFASVFLGGIGIYLFCNQYVDSTSSLAASFLYILAPYKFLDMYVRGDVAESLGLAILPLCLLSAEKLAKGNKNILFSLPFIFLILTHNITAMVGIALCAVFFAIRSELNRKSTLNFLFVMIIALVICAFFVIPALYESQFTKISELSYDYKNFFPNLSEIFYSKWGFGTFVQGFYPGKMSPQIGVIHSMLLLLSIPSIFFVKGKNKSVILFFLISALIFLFLALPSSKFIWDTFLALRFVQIPWRFVGYIVLAVSILTAFLFDKFRLKPIALLVLFVILFYFCRNQIRVNQYIDFNDPFLHSQIYDGSTTSKEEHMPIWAPRVYENPNPNGDIVKGLGSATRTIWKSNYHLFRLNIEDTGMFRDNTSYYPGWIAKLDGREVEINYKKDEFGRLLIDVPKGQHKIEFFFGETPLRLLADYISLFGILGFIILVVKKKMQW